MAIPERPSSRMDFFLAAAGGQDVSVPEPVSKEEKYLALIKARLDSLIEQVRQANGQFSGVAELQTSVKVVNELPESGEDFTIYLVPTENSLTGARFAKYVWVDGGWETLSVTEMLLEFMDAWDRQMYWTVYGTLSGRLLVFQGSALKSVRTDAAYAGASARLTIINSMGEHYQTVEIDAFGELWIGYFTTIKSGFNLIFCETDPEQNNSSDLTGPTAIPLYAVFERWRAGFAEITFSQFLTLHHLQHEFILIDRNEEETSDLETYYIREHTDDQLIWDALDSTDGDYYIAVNPDRYPNRDIYARRITRIGDAGGGGDTP